MSDTVYSLFTDGGARGNPGPSAAGALVFDQDNVLQNFTAEYLGEMTNNRAEYEALIRGLQLALKMKVENLNVFMDSELIVMQVNGAYQVKNAELKELYNKVKELKDKFSQIKFVHVRREKNKHADRLVNIVLDSISN